MKDIKLIKKHSNNCACKNNDYLSTWVLGKRVTSDDIGLKSRFKSYYVFKCNDPFCGGLIRISERYMCKLLKKLERTCTTKS